MSDQTLENISQAQFDAAEQTVIDMVRIAYPTLDVRKGTVIRDMVIRPAAAVYALNSSNNTTVTNKMSLVTLPNDPTAVPADYNAILANFGVVMNPGTAASGKVIVTVSDKREYVLGTGFVFNDINGNQFQTTEAHTVVFGATGTDIPLVANTNGTYYFVLPVTALVVGVAGNIVQGTALTPVNSLFGYISADAYSAFSGGSAPETVDQVTQRLPAAVSYRALESTASIEAKLRNEYAAGNPSVVAVSVAGYGDRVQLRDKHNPMGFAVGSRVDVYVKTYSVPRILTLQKTGTRVGPNSYRIVIDAADAPGYTAIRSISEVEAVIAPALTFGSLVVAGSYPFTEVRSATGLTDTRHDIDAENSVIETAYTRYQQGTVVVTGVPDGAATHAFKLELYAPDGIATIQDFVDGVSVRNVEADYIVRSPLMCMVNLRAPVSCSRLNPVSEAALNAALVSYINSRNFVQRLTRSELVNVLLSAGATRVDLSGIGMTLNGVVRDAAGNIVTLTGDSLDLESVVSTSTMLAPETVVFATEPNQLKIEVVAE